MKNKEIRELDTKSLKEKLENTVEKLQQLKLNHAVATLENPMQLKAMRHDIARMKTELRMRELNK